MARGVKLTGVFPNDHEKTVVVVAVNPGHVHHLEPYGGCPDRPTAACYVQMRHVAFIANGTVDEVAAKLWPGEW